MSKIEKAGWDGILRNDFFWIAQNESDCHKLVYKFGANSAVGTTAEDIWAAGGKYSWPTVAETVRIRSGGNAADDSNGAGAQTVLVIGLDSNLAEIMETITTAGASASSATTDAFFRINRAYVATTGTYGGSNTGDIIIENTTSTDILAQIVALRGQTQQAIYTVPANWTAHLMKLAINIDSIKVATTRLNIRLNADITTGAMSPWRIQHEFLGLSASTFLDFDTFPTFVAKTDIAIEGLVTATTGGINAEFHLALVRDI